MAKTRHGIALDKKHQEQLVDKYRAQDPSSNKIPGSGPESDEVGKVPEPEGKQRDPAEKK
ncbi:hypothetical protein IVB27_04770 [Bradyrhizobium sp. 197]|uniref:hypothetical protein n=1 Tax=Bradyrhizobium sp. 197 TaxID=2782663 RepID=UPI001FF7CF30|nr:hypothetical protein [Bradyrhizobium sp. 197]MCK1474141.1 hypothetical protein [Bradyrhizobium sp. 197]